MEVYGKYLSTSSSPVSIGSNLAGALLTGFGLPAGELQPGSANTLEAEFALGSIFAYNGTPDGVRAYLNYLFLDEDYTYVTGGYAPLENNVSDPDAFQHLTLEYIPEEDGYLFVYLSDESQQETEVYFDDFKITHEVLIKDPQLEAYRYGFNGQEQDNDVKNGTYHAKFWHYDTKIAKRWNIDPKGVSAFSPYLTFAGNPIRNVDIKGDTSFYYTQDFERDSNGTPIAYKMDDFESKGNHFYVQRGDGFAEILSPSSLLGYEGLERGWNGHFVDGYRGLMERTIDWDYRDVGFWKNLDKAYKEDIAFGPPGQDYHAPYGFGRNPSKSPGMSQLLSITPREQWALWSELEEKSDGDGLYRNTFYTSNSLYLLPNGKYANINETGNFHIGVRTGYSDNSITRIMAAGALHSIFNTFHQDDSNDYFALVSGYLYGQKWRDTRGYWWRSEEPAAASNNVTINSK